MGQGEDWKGLACRSVDSIPTDLNKFWIRGSPTSSETRSQHWQAEPRDDLESRTV